jgi:hypothetical protein
MVTFSFHEQRANVTDSAVSVPQLLQLGTVYLSTFVIETLAENSSEKD